MDTTQPRSKVVQICTRKAYKIERCYKTMRRQDTRNPAPDSPAYLGSGALTVTSRSSISKLSVAFAGMVGGNPRAPYAKSDVAVRIAFWPLDNCGTPSSHPLMTLPTPISVTNGWPRSLLESNTVPSCKVPT